MPGLFTSPGNRARRAARHWIDLADTLWRWRKDLLNSREAADLPRLKAELSQLAKERSEAGKIELAIRRLESVLRKVGGARYPRTWWAENAEFFLVAAIVILGIRTYFLQPMVIPTNSMWPSYHGMTAENFPPGFSPPGLLRRALRLAGFGAIRKEMDAPKDGEVSAPFTVDANGRPHLVSAVVDGRSWLIFPDKLAEYTLFVDGEAVKMRISKDFDGFEQVFMDTFFPGPGDLVAQWKRARAEGRILELPIAADAGRPYPAYQVPLGRKVKAGDPLVRFDLMKGEMLVVDRLSYNFIPPRVGSAFVFETGKVPGLVAMGEPDQFFIKRIAGQPGDRLEIREPVLYRNGKPIEGAEAFGLNARRERGYRGYFNLSESFGRYFARGQIVAVPPASFLGLGDNSANSLDGRYWGFVPGPAVIGRPLFIYYPFTRRWGVAR